MLKKHTMHGWTYGYTMESEIIEDQLKERVSYRLDIS